MFVKLLLMTAIMVGKIIIIKKIWQNS